MPDSPQPMSHHSTSPKTPTLSPTSVDVKPSPSSKAASPTSSPSLPNSWYKVSVALIRWKSFQNSRICTRDRIQRRNDKHICHDSGKNSFRHWPNFCIASDLDDIARRLFLFCCTTISLYSLRKLKSTENIHFLLIS